MINSGLALVCENLGDQVKQKLQNYIAKTCVFGKCDIMSHSSTSRINPSMINGLLTSDIM